MSDEEERWHVRIAPGEVKVLTLEQVDDLFRLDMIDEDTLLRQDGTEQWLPLRVVAGLDEDEEVARSEGPAPAPPAPPPVRSAPPPAARSAPPPPPPPIPPPGERAPFAPSPSFIPPSPVSRAPTPPPPSLAPAVPSVPPPSVAPAVIATFPVSVAPPLAVRRSSRAEPVLLGFAVLVGLLVTLHRNGALATLFDSAGQGAAYRSLESALGGPGFGTPRAVDALVGKSAGPKR